MGEGEGNILRLLIAPDKDCFDLHDFPSAGSIIQ